LNYFGNVEFFLQVTDETPLHVVNPDTYLLAININSNMSKPKCLTNKYVQRKKNKAVANTVKWADTGDAKWSTSWRDTLADADVDTPSPAVVWTLTPYILAEDMEVLCELVEVSNSL